jgi:hypothetical protein
MYNIIPVGDYSNNTAYKVYIKSGTDFPSTSSTPLIYFNSIFSPDLLRTGLSREEWKNGYIPPYISPQYAGTYYFRVYAENALGEISSPASAAYTLSQQASVYSVQSSGYNLY